MIIRVRTVRPEVESDDWTSEALPLRKWNVTGEIVAKSDSHGVIYQVKHDDGSLAWYEPRELMLIPCR